MVSVYAVELNGECYKYIFLTLFPNYTGNQRRSLWNVGIGEKVMGASSFKWFVECYTLPELFDDYWRIDKPYRDVMIKIDVETYECKLIPSFYDWLKDEEYLPKMFISFHPQIQHCTLDEYEGVMRFLRLYDHVLFHNKVEFDNLQSATADEFFNLIGAMNSVVIYQDHHAEKFLGPS